MTQDQVPIGRLGATSIDCPDPRALADFYEQLLGMRRIVERPDGSVVAISDGSQTLAMLRVDHYVAPTWPEPGQLQQMHLDVSVDDLDHAVAGAPPRGGRGARPPTPPQQGGGVF